MRFHHQRRFKIAAVFDNAYIEMALRKSFLAGFYSTSSDFPVVSSDKGEDIQCVEVSELIHLPSEDVPSNYTASSDSAVYLQELDDDEKKGLESLFDRGFVLTDEDHDLLADHMNVRFDLKNLNNASVLAAACNMAFRYGMSVTSFHGKLIAEPDYTGNRIVFEGTGEPLIRFTEEETKTIHIYGMGVRLENFISKVCREVPETGRGYTWADYKTDFLQSMKLKNLDGQLSYAKTWMNSSKDELVVYAEPNWMERREQIKDEFKNVTFVNYKGHRQIYSKAYDLSWEVDELRTIVREEVLSLLRPGADVKLVAAVNENEEIRKNLKEELSALFFDAGFDAKIDILCAYKQGFSWISEIIVPKLKGRNVSKIEVKFRPFLKDGQTEWQEEDGAIPSYSNIGGGDENKWYDLPIRFLQELYPVDEIAARELNISTEDIRFELYEGSEDITYDLKAFNSSGRMLLHENYKVETYERPYLSEMPEMGKVHPSTGYLRVYCRDIEIFNQQIRTDTDRVWEIFQHEILPESRRFVLDKYGGKISDAQQPFFSKLEIQAKLSEPNFRTGTREDMISSLDALHEDIYFVASDYYKNFGVRQFGVSFDAPGLIFPDLMESEGKPALRVTLYDREAECAGVVKQGEFYTLKPQCPEMYVDEIGLNEKGELHYNITTENCDEDMLRAYFSLLEKGILEANERTAYLSSIGVRTQGIRCMKPTVSRIETNPQKDMEILRDMDWKDDIVIGYEDYLSVMEELKKVSCFKVYVAGKSYGGRLIYAVDVLPEGESGFVSNVKSLTYNPSELINCRHHANEVSSTNAVFRVLRELVCCPENRKISEQLNITVIPVENVDGTAIHHELSQKNPHWKFHVARFDGLSKEFFHEMFKKDTIHTEAYAFAGVYKRILPDLIVDNHGVPSHEWEQQYSGYTSPSFKGFWLPRSILYGYFWLPNEDQFKDNIILCNKIRDAVSDEIASHEELNRWNVEWSERFEKYAHRWMPKLFPAEYYNGMIFYWIFRNHSADAGYVSWRHPWINTAYFTSEVADETAQGDYLRLCTDAHFYHNMKILRLMTDTRKVYRSQCEVQEEMILELVRRRPVLVSSI